ncbi:hypothetical protein V6N13_042657 [Hibiscus sabdariffa]|uniref:Uncharacterized protein n=1 Tax=Hibiscus sabdariffa TaxID=183260 RepID=A0ABR2G3Z7_9ROSI
MRSTPHQCMHSSLVCNAGNACRTSPTGGGVVADSSSLINAYVQPLTNVSFNHSLQCTPMHAFNPSLPCRKYKTSPASYRTSPPRGGVVERPASYADSTCDLAVKAVCWGRTTRSAGGLVAHAPPVLSVQASFPCAKA